MRRLFHVGFVAASAQILAVTAATVAVTIALRYGLVIPASGAAESELQSAARLLMWIYLFLAVGIALMSSSVAGHKRAFGSDTVPGTYEDLELADLVVLVGSNLAWCHPVLYQRLAAAKQARPNMRVIVVDPRRTV